MKVTMTVPPRTAIISFMVVSHPLQMRILDGVRETDYQEY